jgi:DNA-binding MarR family transcriptional regulator
MDELRNLLDEVRRLQTLVCAYSPETDGGSPDFPIERVREDLHISPEECGTVIRRLSLEGLVEAIHNRGERGLQAVRLTSEGRQRLRSMGAPAGRASRA